MALLGYSNWFRRPMIHKPTVSAVVPLLAKTSASHSNGLRTYKQAPQGFRWKPLHVWPKVDDLGFASLLRELPGQSLTSKVQSVAFEEHIENNSQLLRTMCRALTGRYYAELENRPSLKGLLKENIHEARQQLGKSKAVNVTQTNALLVRLIGLIDDHKKNLGSEQRGEILLNLLYLGLSPTESFCRRNYVDIKKCITGETSWFEIACLLKACDIFGVQDFSFFRKVLACMSASVESDEHVEKLSKSCDVFFLLESLLYLPAILSPRLCHTLTECMTTLCRDQQVLSRAHHVTVLFQATERLLQQADTSTHRQLQQSLHLVSRSSYIKQHAFTFYQLGEIWRCLDKLQFDISDTVFAMRYCVAQESVEKLQLKELLPAAAYCGHTLRIESFLQYSLRKQLQVQATQSVEVKLLTTEDKRLIFKILAGRLLTVELRTGLLRWLAADLRELPDVTAKQVCSVRSSDSTIQTALVRDLQKQLDGGVQCRQLALSLAMLLNCAPRLMHELSAHVTRFLQNCHAKYVALPLFVSPNTGYFATELVHILTQQIRASNIRHAQLMSLCTTDDVTRVLPAAIGAFTTPKYVKGGQLLRELEQYLARAKLSFSQESDVCLTLLRSNYKMPQLFDSLVTHVLDMVCDSQLMQTQRIHDVLAVCARFGHQPKRWHEFRCAAVEAVQFSIEHGLYERSVTLLVNLVSCDVYPEEKIKQVLSHDYIQKYLTLAGGYCEPGKLHGQLSILNESVCRFRPHWNIQPYHFRPPGRQLERMNLAAATVSAIRNALIDICGSDDFFVQDKLIELERSVEFEMQFDRKSLRPIKIKDVAEVANQSEVKRVAIVTLSLWDVALNDVDTVLQKKRRYLQFLAAEGYHVVVVMRHMQLLRDAQFKTQLQSAVHHCLTSHSGQWIRVGADVTRKTGKPLIAAKRS